MVYQIVSVIIMVSLACLAIFYGLMYGASEMALDKEREVHRKTIQDLKYSHDLNVNVLNSRIRDLELNESYSRGVHDARETDALYRQFLAKVSKGEQATIMMGGGNIDGE